MDGAYSPETSKEERGAAIMRLVDEAEAMVQSGRTLVCWLGERITVGPASSGGYVVTGYENGLPSQRKHFDQPRRAIAFFRAVVHQQGLRQALDDHRYAWMFPNGSSLEWGRPRPSSSRSEPIAIAG